MRGPRVLLAVGLTALTTLAACRAPDADVHATRANATVDRGTSLPNDPAVRIGTLPNGLTYYVRHNERPGAEVDLRLVVDAGSMLEQPDQAGVAHFLEHMMFNGTAKYPKNELTEALKGFGAAFGADVNAFTTYDETVFTLTVPNDDEPFATGMDILHEWLDAATLTEADVTAERGVVLDEWRQSEESSSGRVTAAITDALLDGSPYAGRDPIGNDTAISSMTPDPLRRFYDRWYRPDNAAIVVVGDIDVDDVEQDIEQRYSDLRPRTADPLDRPSPAYRPSAEPQAMVQPDPDLTDVDVEVALPEEATLAISRTPATTADLQRQLLEQLAVTMITNRLSDDIRRGDLALTTAEADTSPLVRATDITGIHVGGGPDQAQLAVDSVLVELERAARFGFTAGELTRATGTMRATLQQAHDQRDTVQDGEYADRYVHHFLEGTPIADADTTFAALSAILDRVDADAVATAFTRRWTADRPFVLVAAPADAAVPTADEVVADIAALHDRDLQPRKADDSTATDALMDRPAPVVEVSATTVPGGRELVQPTELHFANGLDVVLARDTITEGAITVSASRAGGLSLVDDAQIPAARLADQVVPASRLGDLDPVQVDQVLSATAIDLPPYLAPEDVGFFGSVATPDLETALAYLHQLIAAAHADQATLDTVLASERSSADSVDQDADLAASVAADVARFGDTPRYRTQLTNEELDTVTAADIATVWTDRFGDATGWRIVLVGDLDVPTATNLARAYLGSLQGSGAADAFVDREPPVPDGVVTRDVHVGTGVRASVTRTYSVDLPADDVAASDVLSDLLTSALNSRLTAKLREELGASYSPDAQVYVQLTPRVTAELWLQVTGAPADVPRLQQVLQQELDDVATNGPTSTESDDAFTEVGRTYEYVDNDSLAQALMEQRDRKAALVNYVDRSGTLADLEAADLRAFAARLLRPDRYIQVTVLPG